MDTTAIGPNFGQIVIGLLMLLVLAGIIFAVGSLMAANMRRGRINEETDITYPNAPQSESDRRAVEHVHAHDDRVALAPDNAMDAGLHERAVGEGMRTVRQSPTRAERPADAEQRRGVAPIAGERDNDTNPNHNPL